MKVRLLILLVWVAAWAAAQGDSVTLAWNASVGAASYRLYWGNASRHYTNMVSSTSTNVTVYNLEPCSYFFAVTAVNSLGLESGYSDEVAFDTRLGNTGSGPSAVVTALCATNVAGPWGVWTNMPVVTVSNLTGNLFLKLDIRMTPREGTRPTEMMAPAAQPAAQLVVRVVKRLESPKAIGQ